MLSSRYSNEFSDVVRGSSDIDAIIGHDEEFSSVLNQQNESIDDISNNRTSWDQQSGLSYSAAKRMENSNLLGSGSESNIEPCSNQSPSLLKAVENI